MEKKSAKISLGTAVCMFVILLLIIALGITYYLGFVKDNENINGLENEKNTLGNSQIVVENQNIISQEKQNDNTILVNQIVVENQNTISQEKQDDNTILVNKDYITVDNAYVVNLINELKDKATRKGLIYELRVRDILKDDKSNNYLIKADYNIPLEITQEEYNTLVKTGDCSVVIGFSGSYKANSNIYGDGHGYGFVEINSQDEGVGKVVYEIVKTDIGYAFVSPAGPGYPMSSSKPVEFYLEGTSKIYVYNEGEKTLKEYAETLDKALSQEVNIPIVTVEYSNGTVSLNMSGK